MCVNPNTKYRKESLFTAARDININFSPLIKCICLAHKRPYALRHWASCSGYGSQKLCMLNSVLKFFLFVAVSQFSEHFDRRENCNIKWYCGSKLPRIIG